MLDDATVFSSEVSEKLKWPTAEMYTATYLKQEDKDRIAAMIDEIMVAYHGIIEEADFLSDETRAKAIEKLDSITPNVLYPDSWEKYSCEELNFAGPEDGGTLWEANRRIARYMRDESVKEYSEPVDKEEWGDAPQTVNCFYNPLNNSLYILGAYAQGGMYNSEMSDTASTTRAASSTRTATWSTGGPRKTRRPSWSATRRWWTTTTPCIPGRARTSTAAS